jgi:CBS domain-containing protein
MTSTGGSETGTRLDIRTRRILASDGSEVARLTIFCPRRRVSLEVEECRKCESCGEIVIDPAERDSAVRCKADFADQPGSAAAECSSPLVGNDARLPFRTPVLNLMTRNVICVRSDVTVNDLIMTLFENGISGAPVLDGDGRLLGIVSKADLLRDSYEKVELAEDSLGRHSRGNAESHPRSCVRELMTTNVSSLPESATVAEAAALMALEGVRKIPILDAKEQVVGIISASDVLTWLARQAGYVVPSRFPVRR